MRNTQQFCCQELAGFASWKYKGKEIIYGSSVIEDDGIEEPVSKKLRISESDSGTLLDITKLEIYKNLPKCEHHLQGCLIAEDGRHLKLNNEMIIIWARVIIAKINGVDATHPPLTKLFDKINYRYPNSKRPLEDHNNNISTDDGKTFLSEQIIEEVFFDLHIDLWIDIETIIIDFNDLFDDI
ncbi:hypothetical protein C1646_797636 [Rhizophagus diaphanus]|nr:hypothetical protein C1646_797636 [Rhizophagus diaphanus] [Rhizophagus sp. MUCL 43196]